MTNSAASKLHSPYIALAVLFVVSFLLFQSVYGYAIDFQSETNDCFFVFGSPFLLEFFDHPAGPLRYAGRFLGQFYHYRWLGALIVTAGITCFGFLFHRVLTKFDKTAPAFQTLLPCTVLLALHTSTLYLVHDTLGLCASCAAFWGYLSLRGKLARRVYALVATPIAYLVLGAYAWFFVAWVVVSEWLDGPLRSGLIFKLTYVIYGIAVPLAAWRWLFPISLRGAIVCPFIMIPPFRSGSAIHPTPLSVTDCVLAIALWTFVMVIPFLGRLSAGTRIATLWRAKLGTGGRVALALSALVLVILLLWSRYDARLATAVACHNLYKQEQWGAVLEAAKRNPHGDFRLQFMTNFALYKKGKLLDEMFSYPQPWGTRGLVFNFSGTRVDPREDDTGVAMYNSDLLYEMGHVNAAFRHAYNSMTAHERTYDTLRRMAECSIANGNYDMARKYLNLLDRTMFHRDFARHYKAIIADPEAVEREFGDLRKRLPVDDSHVFGPQFLAFLILLEAKPANRMALDYLMAWLLLDKSESSIASICCAEGIQQLKTAGYTSIPIHCQEALLLREALGHAPIDLQGYRYDQATVARVNRFFEDVAPYSDKQVAREYAQTRHDDTYLFYHFFVVTHGEAQQMMKARGFFSGTLREE